MLPLLCSLSLISPNFTVKSIIFPNFGQGLSQNCWKKPSIVISRKTTKIRKRYNQVPHQTHDTTWKSNKNTINITNKCQGVSPFPAGDHKAAMNRHESMRNTRHKNTIDPQKKWAQTCKCFSIDLHYSF